MPNRDRHYDDSIHAELRSSYERGRRDAYRERRSSPMLLWAAVGSVIVGAAVLAVTFSQGTILNGAPPGSRQALQISSEDSGNALTVSEGDWRKR